MIRFLFFLFVGVSCSRSQNPVRNSSYCGDSRKFPDDFIFGSATASYQIEGAWNEDGKSESIWDTFFHSSPDRENGDIACDSYHNVLRDVKMIESLGLDAYRFSVAWTRVLPQGYANEVNSVGLAYYNLLIDELVRRNITPIVTMYHWDLPQRFQDMGGFLSNSLVDWMTDYADVLFKFFGDRVKMWLTINEPSNVCLGYSGDYFAPGMNDSTSSQYVCTKNILLAHASIFRLYDEKYRASQGGKVGWTVVANWAEPYSNTEEDKQAVADRFDWNTGIFLDPVFGDLGDFPEALKTRVAEKSKEQGFRVSRLPTLTADEKAFIRGTFDFFGLNTYTSRLAKYVYGVYPVPSFEDDLSVQDYRIPFSAVENIGIFTVVPWGFSKLLQQIKQKYNDPDIYVFENGYASEAGLNDDGRIAFLRQYLSSLQDAMDLGVKVKGYFYWSLMDNLEWGSGFSPKFGLFEVDFEDPARTRRKRLAADVFKNIAATKTINLCYTPVVSDETF